MYMYRIFVPLSHSIISIIFVMKYQFYPVVRARKKEYRSPINRN